MTSKKEMQDLKTRVSRSIATRWFVVAGLGDPATRTRSVESWCRELSLGEADWKPISHASVSGARDAFGTLLLRMNQSDVQRYLQTSKRRFVLLSHQHDEATMRLRSTLPPGAAAPAAPPAATPAAPPAAAPAALPAAAPAARPAAAPAVSPYQRRTRSSKVQNAVVTLHGGSNLADSLPVLLELQALAKKRRRHHSNLPSLCRRSSSGSSPCHGRASALTPCRDWRRGKCKPAGRAPSLAVAATRWSQALSQHLYHMLHTRREPCCQNSHLRCGETDRSNWTRW